MEVGLNKEVRFDIWCPKCRYEKTDDAEDPCNECLNNPVNRYSHKPIKWKEKD